jgi:hypothetical protein
MSDRIKVIAFAVLTVIAVYFLATLLGKLGGYARFFLPLDIVVYFAIGFLSARKLESWTGAFLVVLIAGIVDAALAVGSLMLPGAPTMSLAKIVANEALELGFNLFVGLAGSTIGARTIVSTK